MNSDRRISVALLLLRLSVFLVMLMWALDKFFNPGHAVEIFKSFYFIGGLSNVPIYIIGAIQLVIFLAFVAGFQKRWTYLLVLFIHSATTFSSFPLYFSPFQNLLFFAAWPMLAACFTLYYLRDFDTLYTVDK